MENKYILVSIPASNYVQKARWGLKLAKINFVEEMHAPAFHRFSTKPKGGQSVPLLYCPDTKIALTDSDPILTFCAKFVPTLYPHENVKQKELYFDNEFGPHARRYAYGMIFSMGSTAKHVLLDPIQGSMEAYVAGCAFPLLKVMLTKAFNLTPSGIERSWAKIEYYFEEAKKILGNKPLGTQYLAGDTFSAADISFCSHAGLLLGPPENEFLAPYFKIDEMPPSYRERYLKLTASKAGQHVLYCFKHHYPNGPTKN